MSMTAESSDRDAAKGTAEHDAASIAPTDRPATPDADNIPESATASAATGTASDAEPTTPDAEDIAHPATLPTTTGPVDPWSTAGDARPGAAADGTASEDASTAPDSGVRLYLPALIATAVALPVVLVVAMLIAAVLARRAPVAQQPLVLGPVPAPAANSAACTTLLPTLPVDLGEFTKSTLVEPAPPATRAWQRKQGGEAIVLRCGLDRPLEFNRTSALQIVNGVQWFKIDDQAATASTWFAVDREAYIALTVPDGSGPTPLQEVSDTITAQLPEHPIDPGSLPN